MPILTSFHGRYEDGKRGEEDFARRCARNRERAVKVFGIPFDEVRIKTVESKIPQTIEGISFFFEPAPKADQRYGDLALGISNDPSIKLNIEVKTEDYNYGKRFDGNARVTPNVIFECFSIVREESYSSYWAPGGKFLSNLPRSKIDNRYYETLGGHMVTEADWVVHTFKNDVTVCLSRDGLDRIKAMLVSSKADSFQWFAASTATGGSRYYTIGKKLPIMHLIEDGLARFL